MQLQGKVVFVSDADSESGKAIASRAASEGAHLVLNSASGGTALVNILRYCHELERKVAVIQVNVSSAESVSRGIEETAAALGPIDVLVYNNRFLKRVDIQTCSEADYEELLQWNSKGAFFCTQAIGRQMVARKSGRIIYVGSLHDEKPTGSCFAYSLAQGSMKMLAREAALELGRYGVTVNVIEMGPTEGDDERFASTISGFYEDYQGKTPTGPGTVDDLANLVVFVAADATRYLNGADIRLDGGFYLNYI